jgi:hypothetical protein
MSTHTDTGWGWKIYYFVYVFMMMGKLTAVFDPRSFVYLYYHILAAFNPDYTVRYYLAVFGAVVNAVYLIPLYLYVFRVRLLEKNVWKGLFLLKIIADLMGHSYELKYILSFLATDLMTGLLALVPVAVITAPAYFAGFRYAFFREQIFKD